MMERLHEAISDTIRDNPAHLKGEAIAEKMGVHPATLYRWGEAGGPLPPLDRLIQFTVVTKSMSPFLVLCEEANGRFVPFPTFANEPGSERIAVKAIREFGELLTANAKALEDGRVNDKELARIRREADEVLLAIVLLIRRAQQLHDREPETVVFGRRAK